MLLPPRKTIASKPRAKASAQSSSRTSKVQAKRQDAAGIRIPRSERDKLAGKWFEKLVALQARLRAPQGCPWDREQTHESLRKFLIEETYEVLDAMEKGDSREFSSELGEQQGKLGELQGELGRQQEQVFKNASRQMKSLIDDAVAHGLAKPE